MFCQVSGQGADNLIVNGSFEIGDFNRPGFVRVFPGEQLIQGWEVGGSGVDWHLSTTDIEKNPNFKDPHFGPAKDGSLVVDLNLDGDATGWIQQSFDTVPGLTYNVSFFVAATHWFTDPRPLVVTVNGTERDIYVMGADENNLRWERIAFKFLAKSSRSTIKFSSPDANGFWGPIVDDVQVYSNDYTPPVVKRCVPVLKRKSLTAIECYFSEPLNLGRGVLSRDAYELVSTGPDRIFGTGDDSVIRQFSIESFENKRGFRLKLTAPVNLIDPMRFTIIRSKIFDLSGNQMTKNFVLNFNKVIGSK